MREAVGMLETFRPPLVQLVCPKAIPGFEEITGLTKPSANNALVVIRHSDLQGRNRIAEGDLIFSVHSVTREILRFQNE